MSASPQVFLSYSREDQSAARRVAQALEAEGFSVWWDQTLHSGENYDQVTEKALREAKAVVVLWSKTSVESRWVRAEATQADRLGTLVPAMIEECLRPIMFELKHTADLSHWKGDARDEVWRAYVQDLRRMCGEHHVAEHAASDHAHAPPSMRRGSGLLRWSAAGVAALAVAGLAGWFWMQSAGASRARTEIIPEIARLVDTGDVRKAFELAQEARRYTPDDPLLNSLTPLFATKYEITTTPAGADVYVRDYEDGPEALRNLGQSPVSVELPRRVYYWKFSKEGFATAERATSVASFAQTQGGAGVVEQQVSTMEVPLRTAEMQPAGMVHVPEGAPTLADDVPPLLVPEFFIDRLEVTNAQYKEFVDAGGYERESFWVDMPLGRNDVPSTFGRAMGLLQDRTGRPGPGTWEVGTYPEGRADFPVSGVSWYEAAAYARFRGRALPTYYHWLRAAKSDRLLVVSIPPRSNLGAAGPAQVGKFLGVGAFGTYDLFGNVREWLANHGPARGWLIGGGWSDPAYLYGVASPVSLLERSERNGFRLVQDIAANPQLAAMDSEEALGKTRRTVSAVPVSDATYADYVSQLRYDRGPLNATEPVTLAETEDWIKQRVTIDTGYNGERMNVILFVPKAARPPMQPIIYFAGVDIVLAPRDSSSIEPGYGASPIDYIVKSGRVLVVPVWQGSFERFKKPYDGRDVIRTQTEWFQRRWDLGRTIDYLETRADIDAARIGFVGVSFGASTAIPIVAVEKRIKAMVLQSGGLPPDNYGPAVTNVPVLDVASHAARIKVPVLMINGSYDYIFPVEAAQKPFFKLLGTPPADKRFVLDDFDHGVPPRALALNETLAWFDKYLGPVRQ